MSSETESQLGVEDADTEVVVEVDDTEADDATAVAVDDDNSNQPTKAEDTLEDVARSLGWHSDGKLTAAQFIRKEREITEQLKGSIKHMHKKMDSIESRERERSNKARAEKIEALELQRDDAIDEGDKAGVRDIDKKIRAIQDEIEEDNPVQEDTASIVSAWKEDNPWFDSDADLKEAAIAFEKSVGESHPTWDTERVLNEVSKKMKRFIPEDDPDDTDTDDTGTGVKKSGAAARKTAAVASGTLSGNTGKKRTVIHLSRDQRKIGEEMVAAGAFKSLAEYAKELQKLN